MTNGADRLTDVLLANGVDTCFANPGTSEMHFVAALDRKPELKCVLGLFEGIVTAAADGYARMADKPAATLLHLGPGLANGLANLHNARRARSPMINVVGDHASYHLKHDAPLTSDIESLARPMSHWVGRAETPDDVAVKASEAYLAAMTLPGIATLILPGDSAWNEASAPLPDPVQLPAPPALSDEAVKAAAEALLAGNAAIFLGGKAMRADALEFAGRIAARTGAELFTERAARAQRGAGRVFAKRVPYNVDQAVQTLAGVKTAIIVGGRDPVAFFAYPGKPGSLLPEGCEVIEVASQAHDLRAALEALAEAVGATKTPAPVSGLTTPDLDAPTGTLDALAISRALARALPEGAVLCEESVTNSGNLHELSGGMAPHDHLLLTGGAIGMGIPLAVGAAVGAPGRKVVNLQADGSGMYTLQGLWTQARENLPVVTIILSNREYAILKGEMRNVGVNDFGRNARRMLDIDDPALDWCALAKGMGVDAARADSAEAFVRLLEVGLAHEGPFLIEAMI